MNILEALIAECEPFTVDTKLLMKSLVDIELIPTDIYAANDNVKVSECAAKVLSQFLVLNSESEGGFSQSFNQTHLKDRIEILCSQAGVDASKYIQKPTINTGEVW